MSGSSRVLTFPAGETVLAEPLRIEPDMLVTGQGKNTVLRWGGPGPGLIFGSETGNMYGAWVRDLSLACGVLVQQMTQNCGMSNVWFCNPVGDGLTVRGVGERMVFRDCVAFGCGGDGVVIDPPAGIGNNGLLFDHCNMQANRGAGVRLNAESRAELAHTIFRDCTIQGNGVPLEGDLNSDGQVDIADLAEALRRGDPALAQTVTRRMGMVSTVPADMVIVGNVRGTRLNGTWLEPTLTGVAVDAAHSGSAEPTIIVEGATVISFARRAAVRMTRGRLRVDELILTGQTQPMQVGQAKLDGAGAGVRRL